MSVISFLFYFKDKKFLQSSSPCTSSVLNVSFATLSSCIAKMMANEVILYLGAPLISGNTIVLTEPKTLDLFLMGSSWFDNIDHLNNSVRDTWRIKSDDRAKSESWDNGDFGLNGTR